MSKLIRNLSFLLIISIALMAGTAQAVMVTFNGIAPGLTDVRNNVYAGLYQLTADGDPILGMCDDYKTHVGNTWSADYYTTAEIEGGSGKFNNESTVYNPITDSTFTATGLQKYNIVGYLFIQTMSASGEYAAASFLADINMAIWKVNYQTLALTGSALALYKDAVNNGLEYDGWHGRMALLTANPLNASQEFLVHSPVPEPATLILLGTGLIGLAGFGRKKFKK